MFKTASLSIFGWIAIFCLCDVAYAGKSVEERQMIFVDPETGDISKDAATSDQILELQVQQKVVPDNSGNVMNFIQMPNGRTMIDLDGRFQKMINISIDENGDMEIGHHVQLNEDRGAEIGQ